MAGMKNYLFQSKTGAIIFVVSTLFGVATLVGTEDEEGALGVATDQIEQQSAELRGQADEMANPDPDPEPIMIEADEGGEFASDEELVLDPSGIEPFGMEPNPESNESEEVEIAEPVAEEILVAE